MLVLTHVNIFTHTYTQTARYDYATARKYFAALNVDLGLFKMQGCLT